MKSLYNAAVGVFCATVLNVNTAAELPFPVHVVHNQVVEKEVMLDGVVEAVNRATISSQVTGRVVELNYDVDDYVQKGSVLVRIESKQQRAKVDAAEANELEAQANYNVAVEDFKRIKGVYEQKLVAKSDFEKADGALKSAKERLSATSARLKDAKAELKYSVVRAPYTGVVVERHIEVGELAQTGQPLITGLSFKKLRVAASVPQRYAPGLRQNKQVNILIEREGGVDSIPVGDIAVSPQADAHGHGFNLRANLPDDFKDAYPGQFVKLSFTAGKEDKLLVPTQTVVRRSELRLVYVVSTDNKIQFRQVRVGNVYPDNKIEILAGLEEGEKIALDPIRATVFYKDSDKGSHKNVDK